MRGESKKAVRIHLTQHTNDDDRIELMKLIVGLGNPGEQYEKTRHNVGFRVLDELVRKIHTPINKFQTNAKFRAHIIQANGLIMLKPQTFMNASGAAVVKVATFFKIQPSAIWVIHDDLDIQLGEYKIQFGKGPKVHGGINSIETMLGTKDFWHVRVGVENRSQEVGVKIPGEEYVLQPFLAMELEKTTAIIQVVANEVYGRIV